MNYEDLLVALDDDEEAMRRYLKQDVLYPCLEGHSNCDIECHINDVLDASADFIKPNLLQIYSFVVMRMSETSYEIHIRAQCTDTVSGAKDGAFVKTRVVTAIDGEITPEASIFDGSIYTNPIEVV